MLSLLPFVGLNTVIAEDSVLKSSLDAGSSYNGADTEPLGALNGFLTLTILTDGTWTITCGSDDEISGTPTSGFWVLGGAAIGGIGNTHEVIFSDTGITGTGSRTNGAASYSALSSNRAYTFNADGGQSGLTNLTVTIRKIGTTTPVCTQTFQFGAAGS